MKTAPEYIEISDKLFSTEGITEESVIQRIKKLTKLSDDEIKIFFRRDDMDKLTKELFFKMGEIVWAQLEKILKHQALLRMSDRKIRESLKIIIFSVNYLDAYRIRFLAKPPIPRETTKTLFEWWNFVGYLSDILVHVSLVCGGLRKVSREII
jgi:hypothetical protein